MPSLNKTDNLLLNLWQESDKPIRNDFNSDNLLIDKAVSEHTQNSDIHVTSQEKELIGNSLSCIDYSGNGESSRTFSAGFAAKVVIVTAKDKPSAVYDAASNVTKCYSAVACPITGSGSGIYMSSDGSQVTVCQSDTVENNAQNCFNESGVDYILVFIR